jgi:LuxR family transcriptional regulator, maltose regulon positive regulatory protein
VRFWTYVVEAMRTVEPDLGAEAMKLLGAPGTDLLESVIPALINEAERLGRRLVLVLDDYHLIESTEIHDGVAFFLEHLPPALHVAVATRSDPPLPLARMRARGELLEIRAEHLRFSAEESAAFLNDVLGLGLEREDVIRLHDRTEGWAAGLYLAALSLRGRADPRPFIADFAGNDRHVVDYLGAEVLRDQPDAVRKFMLRTSILDRLCGPLCDAVTEAAGSAEVLREIERANLFLVSLDAKREWYRYHHLFRDLLQLELGQTERNLEPVLHRRAAAWHLDAGLVSEAVQHTIAAGDFSEAGELIAAHWSPILNAGGRLTVHGWLEQLPERTLLADARLCIVRAWTSYSLGRLDEVLPWTEAAERAPLPAPFRDGTTSVASGAATVRASYWMLTADFQRARESARRALALEDEASPWRAVAAECLGAASFWLGNSAEAEEMLAEVVRLGRAQIPIVAMYALGQLAQISAEQGDWGETARRVEAAASLIEECNAAEYWAAAPTSLARGALLEHEGRPAEAERDVARGLELARRGMGPVEISYALLALARLQLERRDDEARKLIAEARKTIDSCPEPGPVIRRHLERAERRLRRADAGPRPARAGGEELTEREYAVLRLLPSPLSQREIGAELFVSLNTVKSHSKSIFRKLGVASREEAVLRAREQGLL